MSGPVQAIYIIAILSGFAGALYKFYEIMVLKPE